MKHPARSLVVASLLALATLVVFWPATRHEFINYDDPDYVTANPHVQAGLTRDGVAWAFRTGDTGNWHPLTWLSHMLDVQCFGLDAGRHHLVNVIWHALNAGLLFLVLQRMTGAFGRSVGVALLFAWHPAHVESVAWVAERKDVLSTFFALLAVGAHVVYVQAKSTPGVQSVRRSRLAYFLTLFFFAVGLLAKPMLVTLPFVLLLLDYWPLQRRDPIARWVVEKIPCFLLSAASSVVTFRAQNRGGTMQDLAGLPLGARAGNAAVSCARYLGELFWPQKLAVFYPHPGRWPAWQVVLAAMLVLGLSAAAWRLRRRWPFVFTGWFWFFGTLIPVIGLVQVGRQALADRYTYWPFVGLFIVLAWAAKEWQNRRPELRTLVGVIGAAACVACAVRTRMELRHWQNSETLFTHALDVTTGNAVAWFHLGAALQSDDQLDRAIDCYRRAIEIDPASIDAHNNLGVALVLAGRPDEAIAHYVDALRVAPGSAPLHNNLGLTFAHLGRLDEAIREYREALRLSPGYPDAHNNLGHALSGLGRQDEAMAELKQAVALAPGMAEAHFNLANALNLSGKFSDAVGEYEAALRLRPNLPDANNNLGGALLALGRTNEAVAADEIAVRQQPERFDLHQQLAAALNRAGRWENAIGEYEAALRLNPQSARARYELGDMLGQHGRCAEAIAQYEAGLQLQPDNADAHLCIAVCQLKQGQRDAAVAHLNEALRLKPDHPQAIQLRKSLGLSDAQTR